MKEIVRMQNLSKRNSLSKQEVKKKSLLIEENLLRLPEFEKAESAMFYYGIDNEVETQNLIEKALQAGKKVFLPVTDFAKRKITPTEISSLESLQKTKKGLLEPKSGKEAKATDLDIIIVPGIAFDRQGSRIGTGRGFYDNLLRRVSTKIPLVGLCFEENLEESLPHESHDVKMDIVVTDKAVVRCKQ